MSVFRPWLPALAAALALAACSQEAEQPSDAGLPTPIAQNVEPAAKSAPAPSLPIGDGFDFYVLSLSWSPS